jgi:hypothetical protein
MVKAREAREALATERDNSAAWIASIAQRGFVIIPIMDWKAATPVHPDHLRAFVKRNQPHPIFQGNQAHAGDMCRAIKLLYAFQSYNKFGYRTGGY